MGVQVNLARECASSIAPRAVFSCSVAEGTAMSRAGLHFHFPSSCCAFLPPLRAILQTHPSLCNVLHATTHSTTR